MKKIVSIISAAALAVTMTACSAARIVDTALAAEAPVLSETPQIAMQAEEARKDVLSVAVIAAPTMVEFSEDVNEGVQEIGEQLNASGSETQISFVVPDASSLAPQAASITTAAGSGADTIIVVADNMTGAEAAIEAASVAGAQVVYVGARTAANAESIGESGFAAGEMAGGQMLADLLDSGVTEGTIGIISSKAGSPICEGRIAGFAAALDGTGFALSEVQYSDGSIDKAQALAEGLMEQGCVALFGANDVATTGSGRAASGTQVLAAGFDNSIENREMIESGDLAWFVDQNPVQMGEQAMQIALGADAQNVAPASTIVTIDNVVDFVL